MELENFQNLISIIKFLAHGEQVQDQCFLKIVSAPIGKILVHIFFLLITHSIMKLF